MGVQCTTKLCSYSFHQHDEATNLNATSSRACTSTSKVHQCQKQFGKRRPFIVVIGDEACCGTKGRNLEEGIAEAFKESEPINMDYIPGNHTSHDKEYADIYPKL